MPQSRPVSASMIRGLSGDHHPRPFVLRQRRRREEAFCGTFRQQLHRCVIVRRLKSLGKFFTGFLILHY